MTRKVIRLHHLSGSVYKTLADFFIFDGAEGKGGRRGAEGEGGGVSVGGEGDGGGWEQNMLPAC